MADLLLHSMAEFSEIILPALRITGAKTIVEVGAEYGTMTQSLIDYTAEAGGSLVSIDPAPSPGAAALFGAHPHARLIQGLSLDALPGLQADAALIDGDHNWYTVFHECRLLWENAQRAGQPFLAFFHDVGWPCARRDLYYAPDRIPAKYRQPFSWDLGMTLGEPGVIEGGFRGAGVFATALREGGPRNGVLTAIEDFIAGKEDQLLWANVPAVFGLGILFDKHAPWTRDLSAFLLPYHESPLLARLEENRLACYLRVIKNQDEKEQARVQSA
jgi:hypothetical protein